MTPEKRAISDAELLRWLQEYSLCPKCECELSIAVRDVMADEEGRLVSVTVSCETGGCPFVAEVPAKAIISAAIGAASAAR